MTSVVLQDPTSSKKKRKTSKNSSSSLTTSHKKIENAVLCKLLSAGIDVFDWNSFAAYLLGHFDDPLSFARMLFYHLIEKKEVSFFCDEINDYRCVECSDYSDYVGQSILANLKHNKQCSFFINMYEHTNVFVYCETNDVIKLYADAKLKALHVINAYLSSGDSKLVKIALRGFTSLESTRTINASISTNYGAGEVPLHGIVDDTDES